MGSFSKEESRVKKTEYNSHHGNIKLPERYQVLNSILLKKALTKIKMESSTSEKKLLQPLLYIIDNKFNLVCPLLTVEL